MKEQINEILDENINTIIENISSFERIHPANPHKEYFLKWEKENLEWTLNFKTKLNEK